MTLPIAPHPTLDELLERLSMHREDPRRKSMKLLYAWVAAGEFPPALLGSTAVLAAQAMITLLEHVDNKQTQATPQSPPWHE